NNPTGTDARDNRVLRGGSFMTTNCLNLWIAYRHEDPPDLRHESLGFRVAL
ncbi:SUMF1/EgtB/PvdO family nonheme iron enzyme, partial [Pseudomonas aeruginosa]|uniref:SUMF1/EgtB/PvdO family nonheme iron enzyme n=1 Tax=Pseudomonas aeruginosa TaxID=287 RepID=UPI003AFF7AB8